MHTAEMETLFRHGRTAVPGEAARLGAFFQKAWKRCGRAVSGPACGVGRVAGAGCLAIVVVIGCVLGMGGERGARGGSLAGGKRLEYVFRCRRGPSWEG